MPTAWRLLKAKHLATAWDGEGAQQYGGRWNSPGVRVVYTSGTLALAVLEVLAHLQDSEPLLAYSAISLEFDEALVSALDPATLPANWRDYPSPPEVTALGDRWVRRNTSAVLRVPSAIVTVEDNFLLNPGHRDFAKIRIGKPRNFAFDARLTGRR